MAIDKSGESWIGSEAADLDEYLAELTAEDAGYAADRFVHARCGCGSQAFLVEFDANEGCARRTCAACASQAFIADSEEYWDEASPEKCACTCGGDRYHLAVAFSHRASVDVTWVTIGVHCTACGTLGACVDWRIDYAPTDHLYEMV